MKRHATTNGPSLANADVAAARHPAATSRYLGTVRRELHIIMLLAAGHLALLENAVAGAEDLLPAPLGQDWTTRPLASAEQLAADEPGEEKQRLTA